MRRTTVLGNWKLNGSKAMLSALSAELGALIADGTQVDVAILPPCVYLPLAADLLSGTNIKLGAQALSDRAQGAYTGEVAASMLAECGCTYVLVGHSERRTIYREEHTALAQQYARALECGLTPVLCVGESGETRASHGAEQYVAQQLDDIAQIIGGDALLAGIIAYEPVWAIGSGVSATPEQAQTMHAAIRRHLVEYGGQSMADQVLILYGGSMNASNCQALLSMPDIDGGLIGSASLNAAEFGQIVSQANALGAT